MSDQSVHHPAMWQRLATALLGHDVDDFVLERRDPAAQHTWQLIARELRKATDGQVSVTGEAVRQRYSHLDPVDTEQAAG